MTEKAHHVWVPRGYFTRVKIKEDDVQMIPVEELPAVQSDQLKAVKTWMQDREEQTYTFEETITVTMTEMAELSKILGLEDEE
ncbi:hypothetical protein LCGC14_2382950 [marine sediment metagenome]|uniref:Uncharacterized protein n=1 Tax=marine sediment metagenome TaxID=412755 RepID=A0A0F9CMI4_9ZZZZ